MGSPVYRLNQKWLMFDHHYPETIRLALFSDTFFPKIDGASTALVAFTQELASQGVQLDLFVPEIPGEFVDPEYVHRFRSVKYIFQPEVRVSIPLRYQLVKKMIVEDYNLIHSHSPGPLGLIAEQVATLRRLPHVHTFHTYFPDYTHYSFSKRVVTPGLVEKLSKFWSNRVDYLIVPSRKIKLWLEGLNVRRPIEVIPNGVALDCFKQNNDSDFFLNRGWAREDERIILSVGRLGEEKGFDRLIRAFARVTEQVKLSTKLVLVGDGPAREALEKLASQLGLGRRVIFPGYVNFEQMPEVYRSADIFAFASTSETQGMVVLEAIASGLPVVVIDDQAYENVVINGKNGFVAENSEVDLAHRLVELVENEGLCERFGQEGQKISQAFSVEHTTKQVLNFYAEILSEWKKPARYLRSMKSRGKHLP